jgi:hypothetical protein
MIPKTSVRASKSGPPQIGYWPSLVRAIDETGARVSVHTAPNLSANVATSGEAIDVPTFVVSTFAAGLRVCHTRTTANAGIAALAVAPTVQNFEIFRMGASRGPSTAIRTVLVASSRRHVQY